MIVGSIASMVYGEPRMTHDMNLVIDILPSDAPKLERLFSLEDYYCPPLEVLRAEIVHRGQFNLLHHKSGLKIDFMVRKGTEHSLTEFERRQKIPLWEGAEAYLAMPEDVILKKLSFYREGGSEKHLKDVRGILAETELDKAYLDIWLKKLKLEDEWRKV